MDPLKTKRVRRAGRELLAIGFWFHACFASSLIHSPSHLIYSQLKYFDTLALATVISFYSFFAEYEWFSILADCCYVYLWPCITAAKLSWQTSKRLYKFVRTRVVVKSPDLISLPTPKPNAATNSGKSTEDKSNKESIVAWLARPLTKFSLLWSLIILTTDNKFVILLATLVALTSGGRAIYELWDFTSDASSWIETLKGTFANQIATHVGKVRAWQEMTQIDEVTKAANALKMLESTFAFIAENKKFLARATALTAICISVIFYCYISFIFSCVYVGLAKIQGIPWPWSESMVKSLYMPIAYTNLPQNIPIELIGGLHGIAVLVLGWNAGFRHMTNRFERIATAATELRGSFEDRVLHVKYSLIKEQAAKTAPQPAILDGLTADADTSSDPEKKATKNGFRQKKSSRRKVRG